MDVKWDVPLKAGQRSNPAVFHTMVDIPPEIHFPSDDDLKKAFQVDEFGKTKRLKTWGRKVEKGKTILTNDPHWIAVRNGTPLHVDPRYPRYSHHLKIRLPLSKASSCAPWFHSASIESAFRLSYNLLRI